MSDFAIQEARWLQEAERAHAAGDAAAEAKALRLLAFARSMQRASPASVRDPLEEARRIYERIGDRRTAALTALEIPQHLTIPPADPAEMESIVRAAEATLHEIGTVQERAQALSTLGRVLRRAGKLEEAERATLEAIALLPPADPMLKRHWFELGKERKMRGDRAGAREAFARAVEAADGDPGRKLLALGELLRLEDDPDAAGARLLETLETLEKAMNGKLDPRQLSEMIDAGESFAQARGFSVRAILARHSQALSSESDLPDWLRRFARILTRLTTPS